MDKKKTELVEEVFSQKFLRESGGKAEFISKVKALGNNKNKQDLKTKMTWKKGVQGKMFFAKLVPTEKAKSSTSTKTTHEDTETDSEFIVIKEDGKLKIDGTAGDAN